MRIVATGLSKTFSDACGASMRAVSELGFVLAPGERVALIGPSGAGKTTLLRLLNGAIAPGAGSLCYDDHCMPGLTGAELRALRRTIATVYQHHHLVSSLPVYQNVLAGRLGAWSGARAVINLLWPRRADLEAAEETLARVGLAERLYSRTGDLSGGQLQRVAIARALMQDPAVILADEPVASLDPALAEEILQLLVGLSRESGKTLVASMHQVELARRHFDRVIALKQGRLVYDGPAAALGEAEIALVYA